MKFICEHAERGICNKTDCRHYHSHEDGPDCRAMYDECGETQRCVMDVDSLPRLNDKPGTAIFIKRRKKV